MWLYVYCILKRKSVCKGNVVTDTYSLTFPLKSEGSLAPSKYAIFLILASPTPPPSLQ